MYKRTKAETTVQPRFLCIEEFMVYTGLGRTNAMKLGKESGCTMKVGKRIFIRHKESGSVFQFIDRGEIMQKQNRNSQVHINGESGQDRLHY